MKPPLHHSRARHDHAFGQDERRAGESRTRLVVLVTAAMMVVEIGYGLASGSMALLADGLHMASHAAALGINLFAYHYARKHARSERFSFGTGKVNALGGYTGAVLLGSFAIVMVFESFGRLLRPISIHYTQAIWVAVIGLVVNGLSVLILQGRPHTHADHDHSHHDHNHHDQDHNLASAYLHVLADTLTSLLAIFALVCARNLNWVWMDPAMGFVGAVLILRWSAGLLRSASTVLLDHQGPADARHKIENAVRSFGDSKIVDLHLWLVAPKHYAAIVVIESTNPMPSDAYRQAILRDVRIEHVTIEVLPVESTDGASGG